MINLRSFKNAFTCCFYVVMFFAASVGAVRADDCAVCFWVATKQCAGPGGTWPGVPPLLSCNDECGPSDDDPTEMVCEMAVTPVINPVSLAEWDALRWSATRTPPNLIGWAARQVGVPFVCKWVESCKGCDYDFGTTKYMCHKASEPDLSLPNYEYCVDNNDNPIECRGIEAP